MDARRSSSKPTAGAEPVPSMTTDNTEATVETTGALTGDGAATQVLSQIRPGMRVLDAAGDEVGKVDDVKMGDPAAATVGASAPTEPGLFAGLFGAGGEPDLPETLRARLLRFGYLKIDGKGWIDTDRYVTADRIAGVSSDTVRLSVTKEQPLEEAP